MEQGRGEKPQEHALCITAERWRSPIALCMAFDAMNLHPYFTFLTKQSELGIGVHCVGCQKGGHHPFVVYGSAVKFSHPCPFSAF